MTLYIASLNSGSNGNCYYVGNGRESVLIDAGIPCRETERRMRRLGLSLSAVKAIFISHEHDDHIRGLEVLHKRYRLPVYISDATRRQLRMQLEPELLRPLVCSTPVTSGALTVTPFPKTHDASDPCSFVVASPTVRIGIFTDLGIVCEQLIAHFRQCHAAFLETNYDEQLLDEGRYPHFLKNRIRGGAGHLSNHQALDLFIRHRPSFMSHLFPSHLSRDNNRPELVRDLFEKEARGTKIVIASRDQETELYAIDGLYHGHAGIGAAPVSCEPSSRPATRKPLTRSRPSIVQGSLF
ncbi:MAG TPA: MBL fold metallo-hydrolase [Puia sp.]|nr:MBL fold metallo-hydrolase [Puia sp.]